MPLPHLVSLTEVNRVVQVVHLAAARARQTPAQVQIRPARAEQTELVHREAPQPAELREVQAEVLELLFHFSSN
ncbi:MAG: hypothetical protein RL189_2456 [Pseudomonadota bacterium]|jgi:hypothetical protein